MTDGVQCAQGRTTPLVWLCCRGAALDSQVAHLSRSVGVTAHTLKLCFK